MVLAIEFLHDMGVVLDLKPENVLLHTDGHICITDFGLAKEVGDNSQVRTLCGTSGYMAPEMLLGITTRKLSTGGRWDFLFC